MIRAFKNPRNQFEEEMNRIYEHADKCVERRTYAGLDPIVVHLACIYEKLTDEQKEELADHFYQILVITDDDAEEDCECEEE